MECRKIQEFLKTDYLDGEIGSALKQQIKAHLAGCAECRRLEEALLSQRALFQKAKIEQPPERIWQNVRDTIASERLEQKNSLSRRIFERLKELVFSPRPVFAVASVCAVAIFIMVLTGNLIHKRQNLSKVDVADAIVGYSLNGENGDLLYDFEPGIEEYFL